MTETAFIVNYVEPGSKHKILLDLIPVGEENGISMKALASLSMSRIKINSRSLNAVRRKLKECANG